MMYDILLLHKRNYHNICSVRFLFFWLFLIVLIFLVSNVIIVSKIEFLIFLGVLIGCLIVSLFFVIAYFKQKKEHNNELKSYEKYKNIKDIDKAIQNKETIIKEL